MADFETEYQKLNTEQRQAVDTIDGPVMVIAGAGTGKTQTIALRIAQILRTTDTRPSSILCLTYTDIAAVNMRSRLMTLIGPESARVRICTFHSFCNEVIEANPEYFPLSSNLRSMDDLDNIEIIRNILEGLKPTSPLITWGDKYFYQKSIIDNIKLIKREGISPKVLISLIKDQEKFYQGASESVSQLSQIRATKNNYSQIEKLLDTLIESDYLSPYLKNHLTVLRNSSSNLSEIKAKLTKLHQDLGKNISRQKEFIKILKLYQSAIKKRGLYDFEDMILFVKAGFKANPDLLLQYQEKYQYILVDEYQDTNSSQNEIIDMLGSFYERPNIFVVGDDDQSVYRFQGASVENIYSFYQKYDPSIIVLKNNYRSHRLILDVSTGLINRNKNRIASLITSVDKSLLPTINYDPDPINISTNQSAIEEDYFVASKIKKLIDSGEKPGEIAILFRKNSDPLELVKMLSSFGINYSLPSSTNILKNILVLKFINLLQFIDDPFDSESVYKYLSSPYTKLDSLDLAKINLSTKKLASLVIDDQKVDKLPISTKSKKRILKFAKRVALSRRDLINFPLERAINRILRRFKILHFLIKNRDFSTLSQIHTLTANLRTMEEIHHLNLRGFLKRIQLYIDNNLPINSVNVSQSSSSTVKLLTVHGSKGLEFNHVFIYHLIADSWENQRDQNKLKLPLGIIKSGITKVVEDDYEEERRLFYVALTRAKKQLYLSYYQTKSNGKAVEPSVFISEIDPNVVEIVKTDSHEDAIYKYYKNSNHHKPLTPELSDYISSILTDGYKFNITHLNAYLRCPVCFFYTTILKVPYNRDKSASFGTAIHAALSTLYTTRPTRDELIEVFIKSLKKERLGRNDYNWCLHKGSAVISDYFDEYSEKLNGKYVSEYNFYGDNLYLDGIPLTGRVDIIDKSFPEVVLRDFKTGNPDSKFKELSPGGDYFRQLVFYKILLDLKKDPTLRFGKGIIDFVEKSPTKKSFISREITVTTDDVNELVSLIKEVYQKIMKQEFFEAGQNCRDLSHLHELLKVK